MCSSSRSDRWHLRQADGWILGCVESTYCLFCRSENLPAMTSRVDAFRAPHQGQQFNPEHSHLTEALQRSAFEGYISKDHRAFSGLFSQEQFYRLHYHFTFVKRFTFQSAFQGAISSVLAATLECGHFYFHLHFADEAPEKSSLAQEHTHYPLPNPASLS